jgi:SHS2 domain-containing protein
LSVPFEPIEHTADLALRAYGRDFGELLRNAARGMFAFIVETEGLQAEQDRTVEATGDDRETVLMNWLRRLLLLFETELFVPTDFAIEVISDQDVRARVYGLQLQPGDERLLGAIKAVTYHGLQLWDTPAGVAAEIVFDA